MIEIIGDIIDVPNLQNNAIGDKKLGITYQLALRARKILIQYTESIDAFDCIDCAYYPTCADDFTQCPARWKR